MIRLPDHPHSAFHRIPALTAVITAIFVQSLAIAEAAPVALPATSGAEVAGPQTPGPRSTGPAAAGTSEPLTGTAAVICSKLAAVAPAPFEAEDRAAVAAFYQGRQCRPLWVGEQGPTQGAALVMAELGRAADWGLSASDFKLSAANRAMPWTFEQTAAAELEITAAVLRYAHQAEGSRIPEPDKQLSSYLDRTPKLSSASDVLARIAVDPNPDQVLRSFQPSQDQFQKLKALLARLRGQTTDPADRFLIPNRGPMLQLGVRDPDVAILKQRFGIASEAGSEQLFDEPLLAAVKSFQASKALQDDGIIGPATRALLSGEEPETSSDKIAAVIDNMEEWRWMPRSLGATHILVNIPSFSIVLTDKDKTIFDERVVVGTADKQTPIFSKSMTTIVLKPRWNIPDSIKLSMLLSGRSIERQGFIVMRNGHTVDSTKVNWAKANITEYTFYQPSGDDNALGLVKLLFPNKHSVYLHDTPSRYLFNEPVRLYSHGCMRVRNPQDFAQNIFNIDRGDAAPNVKKLVADGPMDNEFTLNKPIPVHVGYFTVWVDDDGRPKYYNDWYGHQKRITLALAGKWDEIDIGKDHLAAVDTSMLKQVRLSSDTRAKKRSRDGDFDAPMGVTNSFGSSGYNKYNNTVGDLIRQVLGF